MRRSPVRSRGPIALWTLMCVVALASVAACSDDTPDSSSPGTAAPGGEVIRVPADSPTIAAAVERAGEGALILVSPGTYPETVTVETKGLTIRGLDRNAVVVTGEDQRENGFLVLADGVTIENMTLRSFRSNGVIFTGSYGKGATLNGYRVSYVTAFNNGLYGIYAFNAQNGVIEHTYTSGHPDAGVYVGQCYPCNTLVTANVAEHNAVGFQATNAGGNLMVVSSVWSHNRVGVEPNSSTKETLPPQREATIVANRIEGNNDPGAPKATEAFGVGIAISGGQSNLVRRNVIGGNATAGVVVTTAEQQFVPRGNRVSSNTLTGNGIDLVYATGTTSGNGNCFDGNTFSSSSPPSIETALACSPSAPGGSGTLAAPQGPPPVDYRGVAAPAPQDQMPDAMSAPVRRPDGPPPAVDLESVTVPA